MSTATERPATGVEPTDGRGPGGMWWVAWRQHRRLLIGWGILVLALSAAAIAIRVALLDRGADAFCAATDFHIGDPDCPGDYVSAVYSDFAWWPRLQVVVAALPAVAGLFAGIALFAVEFDRGAQVFVMTQSVGRFRWFAIKSLVAGVPLVAGSALMTALAAETRDAFGPFSQPWDQPYQLATSGPVAAATCLMGLAIGVTAGLILRSPLTATVIGLVLMVAVVAGLTLTRTYLVPPQREVVSLTPPASPQIPAGSRLRDSGYLDGEGRRVAAPSCPDLWVGDVAENRAAWDRCIAQSDTVSYYQDYLAPDRAGELRGVVSAICAAIAALFLAAGAFVLRRRAL